MHQLLKFIFGIKLYKSNKFICPTPAEFYSKNKFEKLIHLVRFILRIYHDARSPESQNPHLIRSYQCFQYKSKTSYLIEKTIRVKRVTVIHDYQRAIKNTGFCNLNSKERFKQKSSLK